MPQSHLQVWKHSQVDLEAMIQLWRWRGFTGSVRTVRRYAAPFRQATAAPEPGPAMPKNREIVMWLIFGPRYGGGAALAARHNAETTPAG